MLEGFSLDFQHKTTSVSNQLLSAIACRGCKPKLNTCSTDYIQSGRVRLGFKVEEVAEKIKMRLDAQKRFAQMHEDRNMNEGIGGQMMKLDPIVHRSPKKKD